MFNILIRRRQAKLARWKTKIGLTEYQFFWMGFGEGLLFGGVLGIGVAWIYLSG